VQRRTCIADNTHDLRVGRVKPQAFAERVLIGEYRRAIDSLMIVTRGLCAVSRSVKSRPATGNADG
jgi:hypothetical protein